MALDIRIAELRNDYRKQTLSEDEVAANPVQQFEKWWGEAIESKISEVNAMALATCDSKGRPSVRIVLLKGFNQHGFIFLLIMRAKKGKI